MITDHANDNKVHQISCPYVKEQHFGEKVIRNHEKNGNYFYFGYDEINDDNVVQSINMYEPRFCKICMK